jgi:4-cresol dehydrogenase (hydroxylating) flavoprotein subunit
MTTEQAVARWREVLGQDAVTTDQDDLDALLRNTTGYGPRTIVAALRPASVDDVTAIVRIARETGVPIYPYSTGKNWGLGSRVPPRDGCALVDLGALNRIRVVNERHHYAIIEPGVTQGQLGDYLRERGLPLLLNVTGSSPRSSVLGNAVERGTGFRNHRTEDVRGVEAVLGTGDLVRTGYWGSDGDNVREAHHYKYGMGPYLDGLFTQSNFGVVTAAVVNLVPAQEAMRMLMFTFPDARLTDAVDTVSALFRDRTLRSIVHVFNDKRILTMSSANGSATWTGVTAIDGSAAYVEFAQGELTAALAPLGGTVTFFSQADMAGADPMVDGMFRVHSGESNGVFMNGLYHTLGDGSDVSDPDDLDATRYGMLACMPFLPAAGPVVTEAVELVEKVCAQYDLVPAIALNPVDANALESVINVYFDTTDAAQVANAHACSAALHRALYEDGFRFYRVDIENMAYLTEQDSPVWTVGELLKDALDPNHVIAPGRYNRL